MNGKVIGNVIRLSVNLKTLLFPPLNRRRWEKSGLGSRQENKPFTILKPDSKMAIPPFKNKIPKHPNGFKFKA